MSTSPYIIEVSSDNFQQEVIEKSKNIPVLVDFWADWCNPCRALMPILARLAEEYQGQFILAKVDTEANRGIAEQERIRSLPTVRMYKFGESVEEFNGALPEQSVRAFIDKHLPNEADTLFHQALQALANGDVQASLNQLQTVLEKNDAHLGARVAIAKIMVETGKLDEAEQQLAKVSIADSEDDGVQELKTQIVFARMLETAPPIKELQAKLESDPNDTHTWYLAGIHYASAKEYEVALEAFINVIKLDKNFEENAARKAILQIFSLLGESGPLVNRYRVKMANALN